MAGLEKGLCDALQRAGYRMLNQVKSRKPADDSLMRNVLAAFATRFVKLANHQSRGVSATSKRLLVECSQYHHAVAGGSCMRLHSTEVMRSADPPATEIV